VQRHRRRADPRRDLVEIDRRQHPAAWIPDGRPPRHRPGGQHRGVEADGAQRQHRVALHRDPGAHRVQLGGALDHAHRDPGVAQRRRQTQPADTTTTYEDFARHHMPCRVVPRS
jgi:hypothetical protein